MTSYDAVPIIAQTLNAGVVLSGGLLRLRQDSDEQIALNIVDALEAAGFTIVRKDQGSDGI